jgi:uncharacterized cupredoxin-like copper-binding protein
MTMAGLRVAVAALAAAALLPRASAAAEVTVELTIHHSRFLPSVVEVSPGTEVRFVVRNLDPIEHELIVGGPQVHARHAEGRERHHHGEVPGEVSVGIGATARTTYSFDAAGPVAFGCHLPGHWQYGMRGTVRVG